jgi:hypothetical protein
MNEQELKTMKMKGFEDYNEEEYLPNKLSINLSGLTPENIKDLMEAIEKIKK